MENIIHKLIEQSKEGLYLQTGDIPKGVSNVRFRYDPIRKMSYFDVDFLVEDK